MISEISGARDTLGRAPEAHARLWLATIPKSRNAGDPWGDVGESLRAPLRQAVEAGGGLRKLNLMA